MPGGAAASGPSGAFDLQNLYRRLRQGVSAHCMYFIGCLFGGLLCIGGKLV